MNNDQFQKEKMYQGTMSVARNLLKQGIISEEEYKEIDTNFTAKYKPILGSLFADITLIKLASNGNM